MTTTPKRGTFARALVRIATQIAATTPAACQRCKLGHTGPCGRGAAVDAMVHDAISALGRVIERVTREGVA